MFNMYIPCMGVFMKRIKLEKQIENIIYNNREAGVTTYADGISHKTMVLIEQKNIKNISTQIKKMVYNNYRRRVRACKREMKAVWREYETDNV